MTPLIVVILAVMWTLVLVPPLLRSRSEDRPSSSVVNFRRQLTTLQRTSPAARYRSSIRAHGHPAAYRSGSVMTAPAPGPPPAVPPRTSSDVRRRRQNLLFSLLAAAIITGILGFGLDLLQLLVVHVVVDGLLIGYVYLLVQIRRIEIERSMGRDLRRAA